MERMGILHMSRAEYPSLGEEIFNLLELVQLPVVLDGQAGKLPYQK